MPYFGMTRRILPIVVERLPRKSRPGVLDVSIVTGSLFNRPVWVQARTGKNQPLYQSKILMADDATLVIAQPYRQGRVVIYNVGATLSLRLRDPDEYCGPEINVSVLERRLKPVPSLVISRPMDLNRALEDGENRQARVIAISSGKGGVGKSTFVVNLGIALARMGHKVALIDADLGTANIDVMLKIEPLFNLTHLIRGEKTLSEIIVEGPAGVRVVPGGSGLQELANLNEWQFGRLLASFAQLEKEHDFILIDTGAGLSKNVTNFFLASDELIVVTNPEPAATLDAYGLLKVAAEQGRKHGISLVVNRADSEQEADLVARKLMDTSERFLGAELSLLGFVPSDHHVTSAIRCQAPVVLQTPMCPASQGVKRIAKLLTSQDGRTPELAPVKKSFLDRVRQMFAQA